MLKDAITLEFMQALGMLSFGSGFYSLLSADDDLRGAVPIERVSASTLIASSFVICIVACAGYTSVVTHSNILLFLYFGEAPHLAGKRVA